MINTAFGSKPTTTNTHSDAYEKYKTNLNNIAWQYAEQRRGITAPGESQAYDPGIKSDTVFPVGFNSSNPEISIPAFLAAYSDQDASNSSLDIFSWAKLRPAWRVKFDGIGKLKFAKKPWS